MPSKAVAFRLPVDLLKDIDVARGDVPRTRWVVRALEQALGGSTGRGRSLPRDGAREVNASPASSPAPARTPAEDHRQNALDRQARLNKAKGM